MTFMNLSQRIELEKGKRQPSEVKELNLDRSKASSIEGLTDEYTNLETLSLVNVGLKTLSGLPALPALKVLDLTDNGISDGLDVLVNCPNLVKLNLSSNKISSVEVLTPLAKLSCLRSLDLSNSDIADSDNYRKTIFAALPNLKYLDGIDENNESESESEEQDGLVSNGVAEDGNGAKKKHVDEEVEDDEHESDDDDDDEEEEYGIEALQRSDLEDDDEEDYAPEDEAELDEYDDDDDEDDEDEEDEGANLSGAGVTGPRRPTKRHLEDASDEAPVAKHKADSDAADDE